MNILKKIMMAIFCCAFFAVRTKLAKDAYSQAYFISHQQEDAWDEVQRQQGSFLKR